MTIATGPDLAEPATVPDGPAGPRAQMAAAYARIGELQQQTRQVLAQAEAARVASAQARAQRRSSPEGRCLLRHSAEARLLARLETMPVIEQAKGIIMAQSACGDAEAFQLLRRASQRSNVPVRDLAAQIVAKTVRPSSGPTRLDVTH